MARQSTQRRWIAFLQLVRLPNVFTAVADVTMGFLVTHGSLHPIGLFALLVVASCSLYWSGMVLNDVFDVEVDSRERPQRPIPSGRVPLASASVLGWSLLAGGIVLGWIAGYFAGDWRPGIVATLLAACVVLYDWTLKKTILAPALMGACRLLNVLLGMSLSATNWQPGEWLIACGVGIYIAGVTLFARTEARASSRVRLLAGAVIMFDGLALLAFLPLWLDESSSLTLHVATNGWYLLWAVVALLILRRCTAAIASPEPARVQAAVGNAVHSVIVIDAALCVGLVSGYWAFAVVLLLLPTMLLTQWLRST
jgi:4-hydroxybenzoate polyprenyltransferase